MTTKMYDLEIEIKTADDIWLTQSVDCGETTTISLHPIQIRHIAELVGLLTPSKPPVLPQGLKKRLERLHDRLIDIHDDLASVPVFPPGSGSSTDDPEVRALWDAITALCDLLDDYWEKPETQTRPDNAQVPLAAPDFQLAAQA